MERTAGLRTMIQTLNLPNKEQENQPLHRDIRLLP
jgi:hypothetical protein